MSAAHAKRPVFALALDAVPPALLEAWMAQGAMPNLSALCTQGAYGRLRKSADQPHESSWSAFVQGCAPRASGEWSRHVYFPDEYRVEDRPAYRLRTYPPFYALMENGRAVIFDVPHTAVKESLAGVQLLGWGVDENLFKSASRPADLFDAVVQRHGAHPFYGGAAARLIAREGDGTIGSYRLPSVYDLDALHTLESQLAQAIGKRAAILRELMRRAPWELVFAANAELHLAMHLLWHLSRPHPLAPVPALRRDGKDPLVGLARAFDTTLGEMLEDVPGDAFVALFSVSGMAANYTDLPNGVFLPELLYRLQFGEAALAPGVAGAPAPPPATHYRRHWKDEIWALRTARGARELESPEEQGRRNDPFDWCPINWYRPLWPRMRAFALPSFSHGMVRINLRGRDGGAGRGMVEPADYARTCDELAAALRSLVNARSGAPIVKAVTRTRGNESRTRGNESRMRDAPLDDDARLPPADLIVTWNADEPTDVVDSPQAGRIGPVPWLRTGDHIPDGLCILRGPGIAPGSRLREDAAITDLTATLMQMLGLAVPPYMDGRSLL